MEDEKRVKIKVQIERKIFPSGYVDSGEFAILVVKLVEILEGEVRTALGTLKSAGGSIIIKGTVCGTDTSEIYTVLAKEIEDEKYGLQYQIIRMFTGMSLTNISDQKKFLSKIITENQCNEIFSKLGDDFINVLEGGDTEALCTVKGIGPTTALRILKKYNDNKDFSEAFVELDKYNLTTNAIERLIATFGSPDIVIDKITENPYILIDEVDGIGWNKADEIALNGGISEYSIFRIKAYIKYYLNSQASSNGHTWVYFDDLLDSIYATIGDNTPIDKLSQALKELNQNNELWATEDRQFVALQRYYNLENNIANELIRISESHEQFVSEDWEQSIKELQIKQGWEYTEEQQQGIKAIIESPIVIIGGGAGTGKSTTVAGMLEVFKEIYSFSQTALSGRASCNLTEITGEEGYTIHRLLGYSPEGGFTYNEENKMPTDIVILDELSMVGADIFYNLVQSVKSGAKLIMLGDTGQLEAIGVGNIMLDMINSGYIKYVELTKIHRQAQKSAIVTESKKVREQEQIISKGFTGEELRGELQDLKLDIYSDKCNTFSRVINNFNEILKEVENPFDIQVIVPMKDSGDASAYSLSNAIQEILIDTKNKDGLPIGEKSKTPYTLYVGDKVLNTRNNYKTINEFGKKTPIFNGDLGTIIEIDDHNKTILIDFATKGKVYVTKSHLPFIKLGYAITTHKLQGSSSPYVICGLDYSHWKLLNKEMVYTMLTRAKKYCVLCAESSALRYAISTSGVKTKQTFLKDMLVKQLSIKETEDDVQL